jgi:hypothetical protein
MVSAFSGSFLPQELKNRANRLVRKMVLKGIKSICKLFLVCIRIPGENLDERLYRIMTRIIGVNVFSYYAALDVAQTKSLCN